ncbi:MAG: uridylate kinase [Candidatus Hepatoplasma vulgare]|nr:MAG: uridylate kinase [Candidatus Hepatoplasma sp.]
MRYKNILLKLSGEAISDENNIISKEMLDSIFYQVNYLVKKKNVKVSIVVGGGNIFRGEISNSIGLGKDTSDADYMGMLATIINALAFKAYFNNNNLNTEVLSAFKIENLIEKANAKNIKEILDAKKVLIFGGGTGKPYVSTDTAAAMRAIETKADVILMAKNGVDGAYSEDPNKSKDNIVFFDKLSYKDVINKDLKIIDHEMTLLLKGKNIDIILFNMNTKNNIINIYEDKVVKKTIIKEVW